MINRKTLDRPTPAYRPVAGLIVLAWSLAAGSALAQHVPGESVTEADRETVAERFEGRGYSPYGGRHFPTRPLFGDTHLHTNLSPDAFGFGVRLGPEEAYRFARGEEVTSTWGEKVRLSRPLDFVVIADHAEAMITPRPSAAALRCTKAIRN
jgi:hypothetical protein